MRKWEMSLKIQKSYKKFGIESKILKQTKGNF